MGAGGDRPPPEHLGAEQGSCSCRGNVWRPALPSVARLSPSAAGRGADAPRFISGRVLGVPEDAVGGPEPGAEGPPAPRGPQHGGGTQAGLPGGHHARQAGRQRWPPLPSPVPSLPGATCCPQGGGCSSHPQQGIRGLLGGCRQAPGCVHPGQPRRGGGSAWEQCGVGGLIPWWSLGVLE